MRGRQAGHGALGCGLIIAVVLFVLALNLAFIAGGIYGGYKAWLAFGDERMGAAFAWAILCAFCAFGVLGSIFNTGSRA